MIQSNPERIPLPDDRSELQPNPENLLLTPGETTVQEQIAYLKAYGAGQNAAHFIMAEAFTEEAAALRKESLTDPLLGISNRRKMEQTYEGLVAEHPLHRHDDVAPAFRETHTAIMIDLDHFRDINSQEGHAGGDIVLKAVADKIRNGTTDDGKKIIRDRDEVGRVGGDELAIFLARTDVEHGMQIAEDIRAGLDSLRIGPKGIRMTASIGVAELAHAPTMEEGLRQADIAAYASKQNGRNQVTRYTPGLPSPIE